MRTHIWLVVCLIIAVGMLAACGPVATPASLEGSHWLLESYGDPANLKLPLKEGPVTLVLNKDTGALNGSTGCNSYFGGYKVENDKLTVNGSIGSTKKACSTALMSQETYYLLLLKTAQSYRIEGDKLTIVCGASQLNYKAVS